MKIKRFLASLKADRVFCILMLGALSVPLTYYFGKNLPDAHVFSGTKFPTIKKESQRRNEVKVPPSLHPKGDFQDETTSTEDPQMTNRLNDVYIPGDGMKGDNSLLVELLKHEHLSPPSNQPYKFSIGTQAALTQRTIENAIYYKFASSTLAKEPKGFFIQANAFDGEKTSNTLWLEVERNWTGLLIEPHQNLYHDLIKKHRQSWTSWSCITPEQYAESITLQIPVTNSVEAFNKLYKLWKTKAFKTSDNIMPTVSVLTNTTVQCFPLITYLLGLNINVIDLLSLNMGGGEKNVALSFPSDKIKVRFMFIQHYMEGPNPYAIDEDFVGKMRARNYEMLEYDEEGNYIYRFMV